MDTLIIFNAKYLFALAAPICALVFYKLAPGEQKRLAIFSAIALPLSYILGLVGRSFWYNPRPFVVNNIQPLIEHIADNGFPSDHTLLLATLATITYFFDKRSSAALWAITLIVGLSRILAQVHHTADILGSIAIAILAGSIVHFVLMGEKKV